MQNKTTSLIFDFDGVIADTDTGRFLVLNEILKKYGLNLYDSFSREDIVGYSTKGFLKKNLTELTLNEIDEIVAERHKLFFSGLDKYCISFQNMKETVEYFNNRYKLFIATTNDVENVKRMLKHLGIFELFEAVIGREYTENDKFEKTYSAIPELIGKTISECVVIEDSDLGVNAAKKEGFFCIRFDPNNSFNEGREDLKVSSYNELRLEINSIDSN